jgi:glycosyltransferase involved in cell wall biosynthesis
LRDVISVAVDGRLAIGQQRGIGKGTLQLLRSVVTLEAPIRVDILVDRRPVEEVIQPAPNWRWLVLRPRAYPLWEQLRLPLYVRQSAPAILHCPSNTGPVIRPGRDRTRLVLTVHDFIFDEGWRPGSTRQRLGRLYRRWALPAAIQQADWLICVSQATRQQLLKRWPDRADRVSVLPTPVSEAFFTKTADPARTPSSAPYLLAFGGIDPRKNVDRILAAFSQVRAQAPGTELVLVGAQGSLLSRHEAGVRALPYVPEPQLLELYASSAGLVYPSLSEGFGVPILEAMALGIPVMTSDRDPMRQLAGDGAILVDPENIQSIAAAMTILVRAPEQARRRAGAMRAHAEAFRPRRIAEQLVDLYLQLASSRP